jgi:hypothetical protein
MRTNVMLNDAQHKTRRHTIVKLVSIKSGVSSSNWCCLSNQDLKAEGFFRMSVHFLSKPLVWVLLRPFRRFLTVTGSSLHP